MAETLRDFSTAVDRLISINRDAEQGFRASADAIPDVTMKRMFVDLSIERAKFASEIQDAVRNIGFEPPNPLGTAGTLKGVWIAMKGALTENKAQAVLQEAENGENLAIQIYNQSLSLFLQPELRGLVDRQLAAIQQSRDKLRGIREQMAPPPAPAPEPRPAPKPEPEPVSKA